MVRRLKHGVWDAGMYGRSFLSGATTLIKRLT